MTKTLALIHTASFLAPIFTEMCREVMPDVAVFNIVDESLIKNTVAANKLTPTTARRVAGHIQSAEDAGADAVLVTCSSIGPAVEAARPFANIPVLRIDQAMADIAVQTGSKIGVIATLQTTLEPTCDLVQRRADAQNREVMIVQHLCAGAFEAVSAGNAALHDEIVAKGLKSLMAEVDVIVLAQASMARVVDSLPEAQKNVPILSSPQTGVAAAKEVVMNL